MTCDVAKFLAEDSIKKIQDEFETFQAMTAESLIKADDDEIIRDVARRVKLEFNRSMQEMHDGFCVGLNDILRGGIDAPSTVCISMSLLNMLGLLKAPLDFFCLYWDLWKDAEESDFAKFIEDFQRRTFFEGEQGRYYGNADLKMPPWRPKALHKWSE